MNLAFCLFKYFPYGGLQRDFLALAKEAVKRGHFVTVYAMAWEGEKDPALKLVILPARGWQNHTRCHQFVKRLQPILVDQAYDLVIGFNKMPGLDVYYAADSCYQAKAMTERASWYRLLPRYKQWHDLEKAVFSANLSTKILLIAHREQSVFQRHYQTQAERFYFLPPGIARDRIPPPHVDDIRQSMRLEWGIQPNEWLLLAVGSGFKTKGLDRSIRALGALPKAIKERCHFFVIGDDDATVFKRQAAALGLSEQIRFLGGRSDVAQFLWSADLLLHPAYHENAGMVLLEALASGLPVITIDVCGYAQYVEQAKAGNVLSSPFQQKVFNEQLEAMLKSPESVRLRQNAVDFSKTADIYSMPERAIDILESLKVNV